MHFVSLLLQRWYTHRGKATRFFLKGTIIANSRSASIIGPAFEAKQAEPSWIERKKKKKKIEKKGGEGRWRGEEEKRSLFHPRATIVPKHSSNSFSFCLSLLLFLMVRWGRGEAQAKLTTRDLSHDPSRWATTVTTPSCCFNLLWWKVQLLLFGPCLCSLSEATMSS